MSGSIWIFVGLVFIFAFGVVGLLVENYKLNRAVTIATALIAELFKQFSPDALEQFLDKWEAQQKTGISTNGTFPWFFERETEAEVDDDEPALH